ncbi:hypothetical protein XENTR_v10015739 [Xenopus tropicalis]|nr:hypothetical protein XENTR_v10015739 [Xenopus tropicalis]
MMAVISSHSLRNTRWTIQMFHYIVMKISWTILRHQPSRCDIGTLEHFTATANRKKKLYCQLIFFHKYKQLRRKCLFSDSSITLPCYSESQPVHIFLCPTAMMSMLHFIQCRRVILTIA